MLLDRLNFETVTSSKPQSELRGWAGIWTHASWPKSDSLVIGCHQDRPRHFWQCLFLILSGVPAQKSIPDWTAQTWYCLYRRWLSCSLPDVMMLIISEQGRLKSELTPFSGQVYTPLTLGLGKGNNWQHHSQYVKKFLWAFPNVWCGGLQNKSTLSITNWKLLLKKHQGQLCIPSTSVA